MEPIDRIGVLSFGGDPHDSSGPLRRLLVSALDRTSGLRTLAAAYENEPLPHASDEFARAVLHTFGVSLHIDGQLTSIPRSGPVVLVANHPFGAVEGLALAAILSQVREDVRILANRLLGRIPELRPIFFLVDPFGGRSAHRLNRAGLRQSLQWLMEGHLLATFPAGEVAAFQPRSGRIVEAPWSPATARLIRRAGATTVPVYFPGRNRIGFHLAGMISPWLRTFLLPRQLLARRNRPLEIRIGTPIAARRMAAFPSDEDATAFVRGRTFLLRARDEAFAKPPVQPRRTPEDAAPIVAAVDPALLAEDVARLPSEARLVVSGSLEVMVASADAIPRVLREIGRLREVTFRAVGEGTGRESDLDRFDRTYLHLFIWDADNRAVAGAYRLGPTDTILASKGIDGLYSSSLFTYRKALFERMGPALEMGRSFIAEGYQKSYAGLLLLWRGIGELVVRNPRYTTLFGPVSISADYRCISHRLIAEFLRQNRFAHPWGRWVRPRSPLQRGRLPIRSLPSAVDELSELIAEIEDDRKGVPVLLRQYLKLGGRQLAFNVDAEFSNVLDVLVMVDLRQTEPRILTRYMGREGVASFCAAHAAEVTSTPRSSGASGMRG